MAFDIHNNLAYSTVATVTSQSGSTLVIILATGDGAKFSVGQQVTIWPASSQALQSNAMIGRITAISTDTLTIDVSSASREGTTTRTVLVTDQIANTESAKVFTDIETPLLALGNFVQSGATVSVSNSLTQTLAAGVAYINNQKITIATDGGHAYTASKDTYVDTDNTGAITYTAVTNGAAAPSLAANSIRLSKVITNGSRVTSALADGSYDSLGNKIYPTTPLQHLNYQNINLAEGFLLNGKIVTSVASNNLTVAIKTMAGLDPDATHPVYIRLGDQIRAITAALSVTKNAGTNWCNSGASETATFEVDYFVYLGYNATDGVTLGFSRIPYANTYSDFSATTTNEKYAAISTITNAVSTDPYVNIGRFNAILSATASFNWSLPGTSIILQRPTFSTRVLTYQPSFAGSGSMTWTSLTTTRAVYQVVMEEIKYEVEASGTTGGTANNYLQFSIPFTLAKYGARLPSAAATLADGGNSVTGFAFYDSANLIDVRKYDASNWGLGSGRIIAVKGDFFTN